MDTLTLANGATVRLRLGDITAEATGAIVNAANAHLMPGGGVCGAIHAAAGPELARECARVAASRGALHPGEAAITDGYRLPARHVIHALGPVWHGGTAGEAADLAAAYRSALSLAAEHRLTSIAFPSISTGIFGYPIDDAAPVAIGAVREALEHADSVRDVVFVLYDERTFQAYARALG